MKITVNELRRLVYEAVAQARGRRTPVGRGPDGHEEDPSYDLSRPPVGGGRLKRQGACPTPPVLTSEDRIRRVVRQAVREALRR